jgi:tRNA1(Val) A37 N6-methylase TrmN6
MDIQASLVSLGSVVHLARGVGMASLVCLARMGRMVHSVLLEIQASLARMASLD